MEFKLNHLMCHGCFAYKHPVNILPDPMREFRIPICTACEGSVAALTAQKTVDPAAAPPPFRGWRMKCGCYSEECDTNCGPWAGSSADERVRWYVENLDAKFRADENPRVVADAKRLRAALADLEAGKDATIPREDEFACGERLVKIRKEQRKRAREAKKALTN